MLKATLGLAGGVFRNTPLARSKLLNDMLAYIALSLHKSDIAGLGPFRVKFVPCDRTIAKKIVLYGEYDKAQIDLLCSLVEPGDHVLDIGANIGIYSLYLSKAVGGDGRVLAFEPDPDNISVLRQNLNINGCENVEVVPCCLGAEEGEVKLFRMEGNAGGSGLSQRGEGDGHTVVPMRTGDEVVSEFDLRPCIAKIDVEGAEAMVLAGLAVHKPKVLFFEYSTYLMEKLGSDPRGFLERLVAEGYRLAAVDPQAAIAHEGSIDKVLAHMEVKPHGGLYGNMLAVHESWPREIRALQPA